MQELLGICDPGQVIIKACIEKNINVIPIPGACAMINSLIASGIDTNEFIQLWNIEKIRNYINEHLDDIWIRV